MDELRGLIGGGLFQLSGPQDVDQLLGFPRQVLSCSCQESKATVLDGCESGASFVLCEMLERTLAIVSRKPIADYQNPR